MKRFAFIICVSLLLLSFSESIVFANECVIPEIGVTVTLPDDYNIMTREAVKNASLPEDAEVPLEKMEEYLIINHIYLHATSPDYTNVITLTVETSNIHFPSLTDTTMQVLIQEQKKIFEAAGNTVTETDVFHTEHTSFAVFRFADGSMQYVTAGNDMIYLLAMQSGEGKLTNHQTDKLKEIASTFILSVPKQSYATEMPENMDVYEGEKAPPAYAPYLVIAAIILVSGIVFYAIKPTNKKEK